MLHSESSDHDQIIASEPPPGFNTERKRSFWKKFTTFSKRNHPVPGFPLKGGYFLDSTNTLMGHYRDSLAS